MPVQLRDLLAFNTKDAAAYDVAILNYDEPRIVNDHIQMPPIPFDSKCSRPTITLRATGALAAL